MSMRFAEVFVGAPATTNERPVTIEAKVGNDPVRIITVPADSEAGKLAKEAERSGGRGISTIVGKDRVVVYGRVF